MERPSAIIFQPAHPQTGRLGRLTEGPKMRRYAIVIEDNGSNRAAYVPDRPGCVATGESEEEVNRLIREAIELHLEGLEEDGLPIPQPSSRVEYVEVKLGSRCPRSTYFDPCRGIY
jgi:predicted RNase H-like HicB family nuclease